MSRLKVGIDPALAALGPDTGHGAVWHHLVAGLRQLVDVVDVHGSVRPDVALVEGHRQGGERDATVPSVAIVYDVRWSDPAERARVPVSFLASTAPATEAVVRASTLVVVPSQFTAGDVRHLYALADDRVRVVPLGVDLARFDAARARASGAPSSRIASLVPAEPYVLFVGSVEPRKGVTELRAAMALLPPAGVRLRLAVRLSPAPGLDSRPLLASAVAPLGTGDTAFDDVVVLPPLGPDDLAEVMARATAVCLPSTHEGFGFPALEAMAAGTPVVVAGRGSLPELVADAGIVVEPRADAIAAALTRVATSPIEAAELTARGLDRARQHSWSSAVTAVHDALVDAVALGASPTGRVAPVPPRRWLVSEPIDACPVCDQRSTHAPVARFPGLVRCPACGAVHAVDHAAAVELQMGDLARTTPPGWPKYLVDPAGYERHRIDVADELLAVIAGDAAPGTLLDVRCDVGTLAGAAARRGWWVTGVEPVPAIAALARACETGPGTVGIAAELPVDGSFDVVVACAWLEHQPSATEALARLLRLARPGGLIVVAVPNWNSAARRRDRTDWHHLRPFETVTCFTRSTLLSAVRRARLSPVRTRCTSWAGDEMSVAAHSLVPVRGLVLPRLARAGHSESGAVRLLVRAYDRSWLGDSLVCIARAPA